MGRVSRMAKGTAKGAFSAAGRGAAYFARQSTAAGYRAATTEKCPHCGTKSNVKYPVCPNCGRDKH